jgi:hypothetical protein
LLGRTIERNAVRHYVGRIFATAASLTLGLPVYDTQCGAKLFRVSPATKCLFDQPFLTRWLFDVEILARIIQRYARGLDGRPDDIVCEFPLPEWREVPGSKVKALDFVKGCSELLLIDRYYFRRPLLKAASETPMKAGTPTERR